MTTLGNTLIGLGFVSLAAILTFLMFYIWKFPFDHEKLKSEAPASLIRLHRILGVIYVIIYLYLMYQMVPRLWTYQIELPARTVVHLALGILIGAILITKLTIVRYFKHMEAKLVPGLGVSLFLCTFLLISLTLPFSLREAYLQSSTLGEDTMSDDRISRVKELLPTIGLQDQELVNSIATKQGIFTGRRTLQSKCVQCHDLRTVLARPRTPQSWKQTVERMANRSTVLNPITKQDQWYVTAYLIAVSPVLQESIRQRRNASMKTTETQKAMIAATAMVDDDDMDKQYDSEKARTLFEQTCSLCHSHTQVENVSLTSQDEVIALVQRMVGNGLSASDKELNTIIRYLTEVYGVEAAESGQTEQDDSDEELSEGDQEQASEEQESSEQDISEQSMSEQSMSEQEVAGALDGELLYSERFCAGCHGVEGRSPIDPNYPVLAAQNRGYLITQVKDIKSGVRNNGLATVMSSTVQNVTDEEIDAIAGYLSGLDPN